MSPEEFAVFKERILLGDVEPGDGYILRREGERASQKRDAARDPNHPRFWEFSQPDLSEASATATASFVFTASETLAEMAAKARPMLRGRKAGTIAATTEHINEWVRRFPHEDNEGIWRKLRLECQQTPNATPFEIDPNRMDALLTPKSRKKSIARRTVENIASRERARLKRKESHAQR